MEDDPTSACWCATERMIFALHCHLQTHVLSQQLHLPKTFWHLYPLGLPRPPGNFQLNSPGSLIHPLRGSRWLPLICGSRWMPLICPWRGVKMDVSCLSCEGVQVDSSLPSCEGVHVDSSLPSCEGVQADTSLPSCKGVQVDSSHLSSEGVPAVVSHSCSTVSPESAEGPMVATSPEVSTSAADSGYSTIICSLLGHTY